MKAVNHLRLLDERPERAQVVQTWNASSNEPMLRINRALGFQPDAAVPGLVPATRLTGRALRYPDGARRGARGSRAERVDRPQTARHRPEEPDPGNAGGGNRHMAAPGASEHGGGGDRGRSRRPRRTCEDVRAGVDGHRGRLGRRSGPRPRPPRSTWPSATSTRSPRRASTACGRRAGRWSATPSPRTPADLELALDAAMRAVAPRASTCSAATAAASTTCWPTPCSLAAPATAGVAVTAQMGPRRHLAVREARIELRGPVRDLVSLLALHGPATGVTTDGLLFPLDGEDLLPGSTRGLSNQLVDPSGHRDPHRGRAGRRAARTGRPPPQGAPPMTRPGLRFAVRPRRPPASAPWAAATPPPSGSGDASRDRPVAHPRLLRA